ncbi:TPA: hypothetical protein I7139_23395 [Vibrio vulnificus]|nr:hypothetical protein [Vibrio vulnificus]
MKFKIKASDENLALLALLKKLDVQNLRNTFWLPLMSNVVAGIVAAAIVVSMTSEIEKELKEIELLNAKSHVVWQVRVEATKENMDALASLHNFIKYDLKRSAYNELEDGRLIDGFAKHSVTPLMFKDYMLKHKQTMQIIKANSALLSKDMANSTDQFLLAMEQLIDLNLVINFDPNKMFPIKISAKQPEYPETAYQMVSEMVDFFEANFLPHYNMLENEYRDSLALGSD